MSDSDITVTGTVDGQLHRKTYPESINTIESACKRWLEDHTEANHLGEFQVVAAKCGTSHQLKVERRAELVVNGMRGGK